MEAFHVGAAITGSGHGDNVRQIQLCLLPAELPDQPGDVVADGLGETGGGHPNEPGAVLGYDVLEPLLQVGAATIDRLLLAQGGGGNVHGLPKMTDDITPHVSGATLGAVEEGHRAFNPPEGQTGPQGFA
jgi:hypothetical protein